MDIDALIDRQAALIADYGRAVKECGAVLEQIALYRALPWWKRWLMRGERTRLSREYAWTSQRERALSAELMATMEAAIAMLEVRDETI